MDRAGFNCLAAIDFNAEAIQTFRTNFPEMGNERVRQEDLTKFRPEHLAEIIGTTSVDVIAGGPPCQGFSTARQRDGANHGDRRHVEDPRRHLYREFLRYVGFFQPRVFVMENVLGIQSASGGIYFTRVQHEARKLGYRVVAQVADAFSLGVPQKRRRQLIIGVRADLPGFFPPALTPAPRAKPETTLGPAIGDLPRVAAGDGWEGIPYDLSRREKHLQKWGDFAENYLTNVLEIDHASTLTAHRARPHSDRDLRDFHRLREGETSAEAMRRGVKFEFPYDKSSFKDRFTRQSRFKPCSTIVAHLSKDGLMFIHPTQNRSLTPREAARIQSFPDWFRFPVARTHQFRIIGNAVPPLIGEAIGLEVRSFLEKSQSSQFEDWEGSGESPWRLDPRIPASRDEAAKNLQALAGLDRRGLRSCDTETFLRGWFAMFYLFKGLHPDNARDHGDEDEHWPEASEVLPNLEPRRQRVFTRSGWPVALDLIGREGWRRYEAGELTDEEFYCSDAQRCGLQSEILH
jgi:DNA (cytosine-5)-methyltransferase 1